MNKLLILLFFICLQPSLAEEPFDNNLQGLDAWVEDAQFTLKNNDLGDFEVQQLSFEVKFKNSRQLRAEQGILDMGREKVQIKRALHEASRVKQAYLKKIDYIEQVLEARLLERERGVRQSEFNLWKSTLSSGNFRADKLQQADVSMDEVWANELNNKAALRRYAQMGSVLSPAMNIVSLAQIEKSMKQIIDSRSYEGVNPILQKSRLALRIAKKQQQRLNAKENLAVSAVKLQYDNKDNALGASVSVRIPITKNSFDSLQKKQAIYYSQLDYSNTRTQLLEQLQDAQLQILLLQDDWRSNQAMLDQLRKRLVRLRQTGNVQLNLDLKAQQLSYQKRQNAITIRALRDYIDFLYQAGLLLAYPEKDWLAP